MFVGQDGLVPAGKNLIVGFGQGKFNQGFALVFAQYNSNGFALFGQFHHPVVVIYVHLHLPDVLVGEFADFQVDYHKTLQEAVKENQV